MEGYRERKQKLLQVISDYSPVLDGLECPFLWEQLNHVYDAIDYEELARHLIEDAKPLEEHSFNSDIQKFVWLAKRTIRQYFAIDVNASLAEVYLIYTEAFQSMEDTEFKRAGFYVAQSCEVVLHLLNDDEVTAVGLKESMTKLNTAVEVGHLNGIRGLVYLDANEMQLATPFLDQAISATNRYFEYVYGKAKTIARLRRKVNSKNVTSEEVELFKEVVISGKTFAFPQLLWTLQAAIRNESCENREDFQSDYDTALEDAWTSKESFSTPGLGRLGKMFEDVGQYQRSRELFQLALSRDSDHGLSLHYYGGFLIRHGDCGENDMKEGFECLTKAGHPTAFTTFLLYFFNDKHEFEAKESFPSYLEKFISCNAKVSYKRVYAYIGHKYYLCYDDLQQSVGYLQRAISFDLDDLTFDFKCEFKPPYSLFSKVGIRHLPDTVDLTQDVGFILDPRQNFTSDNTQMPRDQVINEFKAWWETSGLKPVRQYAGYQNYQQRSERPSPAWRSHNSDESRPRNHNSGENERQNRNSGTGADSDNWRRRD